MCQWLGHISYNDLWFYYLNFMQWAIAYFLARMGPARFPYRTVTDTQSV